jgi:hypothetical protein
MPSQQVGEKADVLFLVAFLLNWSKLSRGDVVDNRTTLWIAAKRSPSKAVSEPSSFQCRDNCRKLSAINASASSGKSLPVDVATYE